MTDTFARARAQDNGEERGQADQQQGQQWQGDVAMHERAVLAGIAITKYN
jgi:hypothetical protein